MYQLLLDSSNQFLAVGLAQDGQLLDSTFYEAWQRQSEMMVSEIDALLKKHGVDRQHIGAVVVGIGPGSYTGVRIAITIARTIAYACKARLFTVSSLSLLKSDGQPTICVINARSGRSYCGIYLDENVLLNDEIIDNEDLLKIINSHPDYLLAGDLEHLNLKSGKIDIIKQLLNGLNPKNEVENLFALKPIYLKDL